MGKGAGSPDGDPPKPGLPEAGGASQLVMQRSLMKHVLAKVIYTQPADHACPLAGSEAVQMPR